MNDSIIDLLNLIDDGIVVTDTRTDPKFYTVTIEKKLTDHYCPICGSRMYSKGISQRILNHPILQDKRKVILKVNKRKWRCTNPDCHHMESDSFRFAAAYKHSTSIVPLLIVSDMKDLNITSRQIAKKYCVSDTYVHYTFMRYVDMKRLPLSTVLSIDEVYMNFDPAHKYPMILIDFTTGEPIDIVHSRRKEDTESYFLHIPLSERRNVRYLVCDMYDPYISFVGKYFPNAEPVVDCFHVAKWLTDRLSQYVYQVKKRYFERDKLKLQQKNASRNILTKDVPLSKEVYLLTRHKWVLLKNHDNIDYLMEAHYDKTLGMVLDTLQYEKMFLALDQKFSVYRMLKEKYVEFNRRSIEDPSRKEKFFEELINVYQQSDERLFISFADLLLRFRKEILTSYTFVEVTARDGEVIKRRLSNAFMESFNNKPKTLKRISKGLDDFGYFRNRILWAERKDAEILALPKQLKEVASTGKPRGKYRPRKK